MKKLEVHDSVAGSYLVVQVVGRDHYLDARKDVRTPNLSHIEVVRNGQVYYRENAHNSDAPERVIELTRELLLNLPTRRLNYAN